MASITRKIQGEDKDITYSIDGVLAGVIVGGSLYVPFGENPTRRDMKNRDLMLKKAKGRDGVKGAIGGEGKIFLDDSDVKVSFEGCTQPIDSFSNLLKTAA